MVQERQRASGFYINQFSVSNCTMNMISPRMYETFILPHDRKTAVSFERFGVHTCNWNVTPYLEVLKKLPNVGYLDMGIESDLKKARDMFPEARRAVMYWPTVLEDAPLERIEADLTVIYNQLSPCDVVMADIQHTTPDSRVNEFLAVCGRLEAGPRPRPGYEANDYKEVIGTAKDNEMDGKDNPLT
jgi:hypothetical protein